VHEVNQAMSNCGVKGSVLNNASGKMMSEHGKGEQAASLSHKKDGPFKNNNEAMTEPQDLPKASMG